MVFFRGSLSPYSIFMPALQDLCSVSNPLQNPHLDVSVTFENAPTFRYMPNLQITCHVSATKG